MTNWVNNRLEISGSEAELSRLAAECISERGLDFNMVIPLPHAGDNLDEAGKVWGAGFTRVGYDLDDFDRTHVTRTSEKIEVSFWTPWSVPFPIFEALAERYPALTIEAEYSDFLAGFAGEVHYHAGQIKHTTPEWVEKFYLADEERGTRFEQQTTGVAPL